MLIFSFFEILLNYSGFFPFLCTAARFENDQPPN